MPEISIFPKAFRPQNIAVTLTLFNETWGKLVGPYLGNYLGRYVASWHIEGFKFEPSTRAAGILKTLRP